MVGDDIQSDIVGAKNAGIGETLVRTRKFQPTDLHGKIKPNDRVDSVVELPEWWVKNY
jgi:ribonucleotide monophosphatase NagD (HAD superfamily)